MKRVLTVVLAAAVAAGCASFDDPAVSEERVMMRDGTSLFVRRVGSHRDVVIFLHGGPAGTMADGGFHMDPLARGRSTVMYDQRGGGKSLVDPQRPITPDQHVDDLEDLRRHLGVERVSLVGLSWGSGLAALYAAKYPRHVERIVFYSPMPPARAGFSERRLAATRQAIPEERRERFRRIDTLLATASDEEALALCREQFMIIYRPYVLRQETLEEESYRRCPRENLPHIRRGSIGPRAMAQLQHLGDWDFRPILRGLTIPVLVIEGEKSVVPLESAHEWARHAPQGRLLLIPDAGHAVHLDQPEAFRRALDTFLDGSFPPGAEVVR